MEAPWIPRDVRTNTVPRSSIRHGSRPPWVPAYLSRLMQRRRYRDPSTDLGNAGLLARCWRRLARRAKRTGSPIARIVVSIEVDGGPASLSDDAFVRIAPALRMCCGPRDMIFRTGPAHFTVVALDVELARAGALSEALRVAARDNMLPVLVRRARVRTTVTIVGGLRRCAA